MFRSILFDMDDTLIKTRVAKFAAHKHNAKKFYNLELSDADISAHWGKPFELMVQEIYGEVDSLEGILTNYYSVSGSFPIDPHEGALEVLSGLRGNVHLGLVTAANRRLMQDALSDSGIPLSHFDYIQTSDDSSAHKPDPRVFDSALAHLNSLGIEKEETLYVGDAISDYQAASGAGINFLGIAGHTTSAEEFSRHGASSIASLTELLNFL